MYCPECIVREANKDVGVNINKGRLIKSLSVAPVATSKGECIINTKGKTFSIREEDQKAQRQNMSTSLKVHTNSIRRLKNAKQNENGMIRLRHLGLSENFSTMLSSEVSLCRY